jgi:hypothetical protein
MITIKTIMLPVLILLVVVSASVSAQEQNVKEVCREASESTEQVEVSTRPVKIHSQKSQVLTPGGSPVGDASIVISERGKKVAIWVGRTASDGVFLLPALATKKLKLTVCKPGYNTAEFTIILPKRFSPQGSNTFQMNPS